MPPKPLGPGAKKPRVYTPRHLKPTCDSPCQGCALEYRGGKGIVPSYRGSPDANVLLWGEAPWHDEAINGEPFAGAAGSMLTRVLRLIGKQREHFRIDNLIRCVVPDMEIEKFPGAVTTCQYRTQELDQDPPKVLLTMGTVPLRHVMNLPRKKNHTIETFHGTVSRDPTDRFWITHTFHPSFLQRGATNMMGVMAFDIARALDVAEHGWAPDPGVIVVDPPPDWLRVWAAAYVAAVRRDGPYAYPLAADIETPDKGADEGIILASGADHSYQINRVNLSCHPDEGVTFPFEYPYTEILAEILAAMGVQYFWFKGYDFPRLAAAGMPMNPRLAWDCMWMWKALQSDLPMGLGFAAPFYSKFGAWKHLSESQPGFYGGVDGLQTRRVGDGCVGDLVSQGQWHVFERHMHDFHRTALQPATDVGIFIDRDRLNTFGGEMAAKATDLLNQIQETIPDALLPLTGGAKNEGLTRPPTATEHTKARSTKQDGTEKKHAPDPIKAELFKRAVVVEKLVLRQVLACRNCGLTEVTTKHRCKIPGDPRVELTAATVRRWFWKEPFNPDSHDQLMSFVTHKGYQPGKSKQTGNPSVDRDTLSRLLRETKDPFFQHLLDYKAVIKVKVQYVDGTLRRLDAEDRVHPQTTFKPNTMRTSQVNPNWQNVRADKDGKKSIAAGFRHCVVARGAWVEEGSGWEDGTAD